MAGLHDCGKTLLSYRNTGCLLFTLMFEKVYIQYNICAILSRKIIRSRCKIGKSFHHYTRTLSWLPEIRNSTILSHHFSKLPRRVEISYNVCVCRKPNLSRQVKIVEIINYNLFRNYYLYKTWKHTWRDIFLEITRMLSRRRSSNFFYITRYPINVDKKWVQTAVRQLFGPTAQWFDIFINKHVQYEYDLQEISDF